MSLRTKQYISYVITFIIYATIIPWQTALLLMGGIGFHEMGHLWAGRKLGFQDKGFFLIPFVGGLSLTEGNTKRYTEKVFVAIMGPVWGAALALATYFLYVITGSSFIGEAALWMAFVNLFNLLPLSFMDGGQIMESIIYSISETFGLVVMSFSTLAAVPLLWRFNPVLAFMVGFFGAQVQYKAYTDWKIRQKMGVAADYAHPLPKAMDWKRLLVTVVCYVGLAIGLLFLMTLIKSHSLDMNNLFKR